MSKANLRDVVAYILKTYPKNLAHELSTARLTKMVYLSDWKSCIESGDQITDINWYFDNFGPYVDDIKQLAIEDDEFEVENTTNMYGQPKRRFKLKQSDITINLTDEVRSYIDHTIQETKKLYWNSFIQLVYSTYPISSSERYRYLDLASKAKEYKEA